MSNHGITERVERLGEHARERMAASRMQKLDRDNDRLRTEVELLRDDLHEERASMKEAMKGLTASEKRTTVKVRRRPHVLRTVVIAGGAYLLGSKAGRERYDQVVTKARSISESIRGRLDGARQDPWDMVGPANVVESSGTGADPASPGSASSAQL